MVMSEWVFHITSQEKLNNVLSLISKHKETITEDASVGKELICTCIVRKNVDEKPQYYLVVVNHGGRQSTSAFILKNYRGGIVFYPFQKPEWWSGCSDYVWEKTAEVNIPTYPTN